MALFLNVGTFEQAHEDSDSDSDSDFDNLNMEIINKSNINLRQRDAVKDFLQSVRDHESLEETRTRL